MNVKQLMKAEIFVILAAFFIILIAFEKTPVFNYTEAEGFSFKTGSSQLSWEFREALIKNIIPELEKKIMKSGYNTVEIIGHTDGQVHRESLSNLDSMLLGAIRNKTTSSLHHGSNLDLGIMRALSVREVLIEAQSRGRLKGLEYILPYSAGQILGNNNKLANPSLKRKSNKRRRIEIRLLRI